MHSAPQSQESRSFSASTMVPRPVLLAVFFSAFAAVVLPLAYEETRRLDPFRLPIQSGRIQPNHLYNKDERYSRTISMDTRYIQNPPCENPSLHCFMEAGDSIDFTSPRYPRKYPKRKYCGWNFEGSSNFIFMKISCNFFKLQKPKKNGKCKDFLSLNNQKFCGRQLNMTTEWSSDSSIVKVRFASNGRTTKRGFKCTISASDLVPNDTDCGVTNPSTKIIGGVPTDENEFPWQVAIATSGEYDFRDFYCGGSILNKKWILSAAHCQISTDDQVIIGAHNLFYPPASSHRVNVATVINHPHYDPDNYDHDVAVVSVDEVLDFNLIEIGPVCLPPLGSTITFEGSTATVIGWGNLDYDYLYPEELQEANVLVVSNAVCTADYGAGKITDNMLCAGIDEGGSAACQGDSGGPLMVLGSQDTHIQIGVVSWGIDCGYGSHYGVYARVSEHLPWILSKVGAACTT